MSDFASIAYPNDDTPVDVLWPLLGQFGVGSAFQQNGLPRYSQSPYGVFGAPTIAGAGVANMGLYKGIFCGQFETDAAAGTAEATMDGVSMYAGIVKTGLAGSFKFGEAVRVWRLSFAMALQVGAALSSESGIVLEPAANAAPGWIAAGNRGMGIVFTAGVPTYVAKNAGGVGVFQEAVSLASSWPGAITDWAGVEFEIQSATGTGEAVFRLRLNGVIVIERTWAAGTFLPTYASPASAARFTGHIRMGDTGVAESLKIAAGIRFSGGRFTADRAEL